VLTSSDEHRSDDRDGAAGQRGEEEGACEGECVFPQRELHGLCITRAALTGLCACVKTPEEPLRAANDALRSSAR